jgi:hypothetical protein
LKKIKDIFDYIVSEQRYSGPSLPGNQVHIILQRMIDRIQDEFPVTLSRESLIRDLNSATFWAIKCAQSESLGKTER